MAAASRRSHLEEQWATRLFVSREWGDLFSNTCENIPARVCFCRSEFIGLTATRMTRGDELSRHMIPESGWPRFLQATVAEWAAILCTSAVTIISPAAAKDIRKNLSHRIVPSRHVCREKPGEGVGAASKAKCRWCVLGHRDPDIRQLERSSPTPQTSSMYTFLFVAAVLQRRVTRICPKGHRASFTQVFPLEASLLPTGPGSRKVL